MSFRNILDLLGGGGNEDEEMEEKKFLKIAIGSTSFLKKKALERSFPNCEILEVDCESGVPSQPIGKEQTIQGAKNRCDRAK